MARIIDCSMIVSNQTWRPIWRVDISTKKQELMEIEGVRVQPCASGIHMSAHCATHIDSPLHYIEGGPTFDSFPIDRCCGPAAVVDFRKWRRFIILDFSSSDKEVLCQFFNFQ